MLCYSAIRNTIHVPGCRIKFLRFLFWSEVPQSIHNYAAPFITIILPLTNFFLSASATYTNIIRICRNTAETTDRLARADYLLSRILSHAQLSLHLTPISSPAFCAATAWSNQISNSVDMTIGDRLDLLNDEM